MPLQESIAPQQISKPAVTLSIGTLIFRFGPGYQYASATILLKDEDGNQVSSRNVRFTDEDLSGWGSDDQALIDIVKTKLGM